MKTKIRGYFKNQQGYIILRFRNKVMPLHRYIWIQHHGKIPPGMEVHHIDSDITHNDINNYELITKDENLKLRKYPKRP